MLNTSQSSFIPKNNLSSRQKVGRHYNFFFVSLVVYGLFIATPIASAVVFIYEKHTTNIINQTTRDLDAEIRSFSEGDLLTAIQFDNRLIASAEVLADNLPLNLLFEFFLQNAPQTVSFTSIKVEMADEKKVAVTAEVASESFDYVLFYRDELLHNSTFNSSEISNVTYQGTDDEQNQSSTSGSGEGAGEQNSKLSYQMTFTIPIEFFTNIINLSDEVLVDPEVQTEVLLDNTNNQ